MIPFDKWVLPEGEQHLQGWMTQINKRVNGRLSYQYSKYEEAMKYVTNRKLCVDVGSHVGLWAYHMAHDFQEAHCFEPMPEHIECWRANMLGQGNAILHDCALGDVPKMVAMGCRTAGSSGDTGVLPDEAGGIPMVTLDEYDFNDVGLIKIDCEGYEAAVIMGAAKTLKRCKPVVVVEQKADHHEKYGFGEFEAVWILEQMGAKKRSVIAGDYILSWGD